MTFQNALNVLRNEVNTYNRANGVTKYRAARQQRNISSAEVDGRTKRRTDSTWEKLTNREIIEYHPSFRFGSKLQLFPKELREKLDKERRQYKEKNKRKRNPSGTGKRSIKKVKKELKQLSELVGLMDEKDDRDGRTIYEVNSNTMGGRNSRQAKKESGDSSSKASVKQKIAELKS